MNLLTWTPAKVQKFWEWNEKYRPEPYFSNVLKEHLYRLAKPYMGERVLDYGSGTGAFVKFLEKKKMSAFGFDLLMTTLSDFEAWDCITCFEVLEHLDDNALAEAMTQIIALLKKGGFLVVSTPYQENLNKAMVFCPDCEQAFHPMQHVRSWTISKLTCYLEYSGFDVIRVETTDIWASYNPRWWVRFRYFVESLFGHTTKGNLVVVARKL